MMSGEPPRSGWVLEQEDAPGPVAGYAFEGFWRRFGAFVIDQIILSIPTAFLFFTVLLGPLAAWSISVFDTSPGAPTSTRVAFDELFRGFALAWVVIFGVQLVYHVVCWSRFGGTPGQLLLGMQVRNEADGTRIGIVRAFGRYIGFLVSMWILYLGLIWVAFDGRKQGWHDKFARTLVVRRVG